MSEQYKKAGVDIHAGYEAVSRIKKHVEKTRIPGVLGGLGGFGGLFQLDAKAYDEPVLVSGADGVGTKLALAFAMGKHNTIGIDAVAMCVNDIITVGARPLFFLDYIACGRLEPDVMEAIVAGVAEGCVQAGCALIGGEMAEHPGLMPPGEYDVAGFCVGVVEKRAMLTGADIKEGDVLVGLASSGVHSNGFSLIRKIIADSGLSLEKTYPGFDRSLGEVLLTPTRIYSAVPGAKGMAHISGGGFIENIPRILPAGLSAEIDCGSWEVPHIFRFLQERGGLNETEMFNTYNMGIGMVAAMDEKAAQKTGAPIIGRVVRGEAGIIRLSGLI